MLTIPIIAADGAQSVVTLADPVVAATGASSDGTRVPPATQIIDAAGNVWAIGAGTGILKNGNQTGGQGTVITWCFGRIRVLGTDNQWWLWSEPPGTSWTAVGSADPCLAPPPPPPATLQLGAFLSAAGSDTNDGLTAATAWKTIARANAASYLPGSHIRLRGGDVFDGNLKMNPTTVPSRGDQANPIIIESYGTGPLAEVNPTASGETGIAHIDRVSGVTVQNLKLTAPDLTKMPRGGVLISNNSAQRIGGITIQDNDISGIRYTAAFGDFGGEVFIEGYPGTGGIENVLIQNNNLHGRDGITSQDDLGIGGFGGGLNIFNVVQRGNLCRHIGSAGGVVWPPMGDGLDFNGVNGGLAEFNIVHDNAYNYVPRGSTGGPTGFLTARVNAITHRFNEAYNIQPPDGRLAVDYAGLDYDNASSNCLGELNYFHDNYGPGMMLFDREGNWDNNTLRKNLLVDNSKQGTPWFSEILYDVPGGNPTIHIDDNVIYNDRIYSGPAFGPQGQYSSFLRLGYPCQGTINGNIAIVSACAPSGDNSAVPLVSGADPAFACAATIAGNKWFIRSGSVKFIWATKQYWSLAEWQTASGKGPNTVTAGPGPAFSTYALALTAAERTIATAALAAITTIPGIDIVGTRAAALRTRLLAGDSPVTLPEFIALGFALTRMNTPEASTLLTRTKTLVTSAP